MDTINKIYTAHIRKDLIKELLNRYGDKLSTEIKLDFKNEIKVENLKIITLKSKLINELK